MPNHDLVNRDLAFLNEYRTSIGIKLLLLYLLLKEFLREIAWGHEEEKA